MTEIHTRAVNGNGAFNWRFIFNFQYAYLKRKVMIKGSVSQTTWAFPSTFGFLENLPLPPFALCPGCHRKFGKKTEKQFVEIASFM